MESNRMRNYYNKLKRTLMLSGNVPVSSIEDLEQLSENAKKLNSSQADTKFEACKKALRIMHDPDNDKTSR